MNERKDDIVTWVDEPHKHLFDTAAFQIDYIASRVLSEWVWIRNRSIGSTYDGIFYRSTSCIDETSNLQPIQHFDSDGGSN